MCLPMLMSWGGVWVGHLVGPQTKHAAGGHQEVVDDYLR